MLPKFSIPEIRGSRQRFLARFIHELSIFVCFASFCFVEPVPVHGTTFKTGNSQASPSEVFTIPITVSDFHDIVAFQFSLKWDPTVMLWKGAEGFALPNFSINNVGTENSTQGILVVQWDESIDLDAGRSLADDAILFSLRMQAIGEIGQSTSLSFTDLPSIKEIVDTSFLAQPFNSQDAFVQIQTGSGNEHLADISGSVRFHGNELPVPNMEVSLTNGEIKTAVTDGNGKFQFSASKNANYILKPTQRTDNPANRGVTTLDILLIRRHILDPINPSTKLDDPFQYLAADVNDSQSITTLDILLIRRLILNPVQFDYYTSKEQPIWKFVPSDYIFPDYSIPWTYLESREFLELSETKENQNFIAIKLGDVNRSW